MRDGNTTQTVGQAQELYNGYVQSQLNSAVTLQNSGHHKEAIGELGKGMHALADSTSPMHKGCQKWRGLDGPLNWLRGARHAAGELWPSRAHTNEAAGLLQGYYTPVFQKSERVTLNGGSQGGYLRQGQRPLSLRAG